MKKTSLTEESAAGLLDPALLEHVRPSLVRFLLLSRYQPHKGGQSRLDNIRTQYAVRVHSDVPIICQYDRLEVLPSYELYTTIGYVEPEGDVQ
jgi:hypothetical protein